MKIAGSPWWFLLQLLVSFAVLFIVYIIYAILDVDEADMVSGISLILFQPILGLLFTIVTIAICLLIGLPIRLKANLKEWWQARPLISIAGFLLGLLFLFLAFNSNFTDTNQIILNGETVDKEVPNPILSVTGWFLTGFCLLHYYPKSEVDNKDQRRTK